MTPPGGRKGKAFAGMDLAGLPSVGKAQGKSTHGGHFPYVSYLKVINQANNPPTSTGDAEDSGSIPESERSPREGNGIPLQYPCLENSTDRGAWQATGHGVTKSRT